MDDKLNLLEQELMIEEKKYYEDFDENIYGDTLEPGSLAAPSFYEGWISTYKPKVVIEVGSFLGYSAINMAKSVKKHKLQTKIICVDTWLGSPEHFRMQKSKEDIRLGYKNGYPTLYQKFISNVIIHKVQDVIIPLPYPSSIAFKILEPIFKKIDIQADFIFLDGSHEEHDVYMDIYYYYQLLKETGTLWGDDYGWEGVKNAVDNFCNQNKITYQILPQNVHWFITKK